MQIETQFEKAFGYAPELSRFTPGRVNLIGEHIDYNGGMVLPTALELGIASAIKPRNDKKIRIISDKFDTIAERTLEESKNGDWSDYALGAVIYANKVGFLTGGADIAISANLPFGAGLSSSSALTVGLLKLARDCGKKAFDNEEISKLARCIENEFIGMPCGIMDQMAVAIAKPGEALALNTKSLNYEVVGLPEAYQMAVIHSGQYRLNSDGHYKARKEECDAIKAAIGHNDICLMTQSERDKVNALDANLIKRARHCVTEHQRTLAAVEALKNRNMETLGQLMYESHISMRDDFEMSLPPIDSLVSDAVKLGALGARLTGGGFGGCIVACVKATDRKEWQADLLKRHPQAFSVA